MTYHVQSYKKEISLLLIHREVIHRLIHRGKYDQMKILIACECSGIVRDAFIAKGHDVMSCDIKPTEQTGPHYEGDIQDIIDAQWDMMIAFPPCTHLAVSGAAHFEIKKADGRQDDAIDFFMSLANEPIDKICIENPVGIMSTLWREPDQIVQPFYFGDPVTLSCLLWL
jgi:hypothetical protein